MTIDPVFKLILAASLGVVSKIVYDWLITGRVEKGIYVLAEHCEEIRDKCCMPQIKRDVGILKSKSMDHEKKLDEGRENFNKLRDDISSIKESLAGIEKVLESLLGRMTV